VLIKNLCFYGHTKQNGVIKTGNGIMKNRKWNYFSNFWTSDQKTSLTKVVLKGHTTLKIISETGNGIIETGNGIISPTSGPWIIKLL
jgi:hypothetical protein